MKLFKQCGEVDVRFVIIIALFELICLHIIYSCVYQYSNIKAVVDAFGFGGTLVGILVGVIAIIYAFYQGAAQQQTNNTMVAELTKLSSIKEEIALSSSNLKNQLRDLGLFANRLETIDQNVIKTQSQMESFSLMFSKRDQEKTVGDAKLVVTDAVSRNSYIDFIKKYISIRKDVLVFADAFILRSSSSGKTYLEYAQELIKIVKEDESRNTFVTDEFYMQAIAMVVQVYKAADVLDAKWEDGKIEWNVDGKFADARLQIIEYLRKHVDEDNKPTLEKILKI